MEASEMAPMVAMRTRADRLSQRMKQIPKNVTHRLMVAMSAAMRVTVRAVWSEDHSTGGGWWVMWSIRGMVVVMSASCAVLWLRVSVIGGMLAARFKPRR